MSDIGMIIGSIWLRQWKFDVSRCLFPSSWPLVNKLAMVNHLMYLGTIPHLLLPSWSSTQLGQFCPSGVGIGRKRTTRRTVKFISILLY